MLHQDPLDFPPLSALENFMLGAPGYRQPRAAARRSLLGLCDRYGFSLDPDAPASTLSPGERQQLELVRLLARGAELLILDEPTTGISQTQKIQLFATLKALAASGKSVVLVTHKLQDAEMLCERVTVLRRGRRVGEVVRPFTAAALVRLMFGQEMPRLERDAFAAGKTVLEVRDLSASDHRLHLEGVAFTAGAGEVIGFAGLEGSGQRLLMRTLAGLHRVGRGAIVVNGRDLARQPYARYLQSGVAYVPAARLDEGLVAGLNLVEHFELARRGREFLVDWGRAHRIAAHKIDAFRIRGHPNSRVEELSGGNQQRALLAFAPESPSLLLLEHPTRGLDIESTQWVWSQLLERRRRGTAIIFTSADLDEIATYSDRIFVFSGGAVSRPVNARDTSVEQLGNLIGGKGFEAVR
jgi:simple sugar transport system ATP-binding protein